MHQNNLRHFLSHCNNLFTLSHLLNGRNLGIFVLVLVPKTRRRCIKGGQPTDEGQQHEGWEHGEENVGQPTDESDQGTQ